MIFYLQVEAALTNSPDDPELMKLKTDLEEVIELTAELVRTQTQPKKEVGMYNDIKLMKQQL